MNLLEELKALGVDVDDGLRRLSNKEALYIKLIKSLPKTIEKYYVGTDFDNTDYKEAAEKAHAIKGATGNLSITPLYKGYTEVVDLLRSDQPEQARAVLEEILPVQDKILQCIEEDA